MTIRTLLIGVGGAAAGAGAQYLMDPDRGHARRARLADQGGARARRATRMALRRAHYARGLVTGRLQARRAVPLPPADDRELIQKIRSEVLGRSEHRDLDVVIDACNGVVHLRGGVADTARAKALVDAVAHIDGVRAIDNFLHAPGAAAPNKAESLRLSERARAGAR